MEGLLNLVGNEDNPNSLNNGSTISGNLGRLIKGNATNGKMDLEKKKEGMKVLGDLMSFWRKAKANDTEGAGAAMMRLTDDLSKYTSESNGNETSSLGNLMMSLSGSNETETEYGINGTNSTGSLFKENLNSSGHHRRHFTNLTELWNNSTEDSLFPSFQNMSTGLSDRDVMSLDRTSDLNKTYSESSFLSIFANLTMVTFFYYVPRMLYYRGSNYSKDSQHSSFVPILYLSLIACAGAGAHIAIAYYQATHNAMSSFLTGNFDVEDDRFTRFIYKSIVSSINRIVSPIVCLLCLQQISTHSQHNVFYIFQKTIAQWVYCILFTLAIFGYSFAKEYYFMQALDEFSYNYPDHIHVDLVDLIFPFLTAVSFLFAKNAISRQSVYTTEKYGPNGPTTLDRVSKVVVFQAVMAFFAVCAIFWSASEEEELEMPESATTWYYFFITSQTPVVHFVLFRSLLRSQKSTRICFLVCCHSGEKISTADNGVELNQHPRTNEPSEKNEEEEEEDNNNEENTMETLDHNKIIIMPEGKDEEKPQENN